MRSGHYNHQRHARRQAQFFALVEADRQARQRIVGSFDNMDFEQNMPLTFTEVSDSPTLEPQREREDDAWQIWDTER